MISEIINTLSIKDSIIVEDDDRFHLTLALNGENKILGTFESFQEAEWVAALMAKHFILAQLANRRRETKKIS